MSNARPLLHSSFQVHLLTDVWIRGGEYPPISQECVELVRVESTLDLRLALPDGEVYRFINRKIYFLQQNRHSFLD
jgi:hypothetical protein